MTTTTLRLPPRLERLPQLRRIVRGGLAARGSVGAGLAAKAGGAAGNGLLNSLIAYWPLNEAAGANNALDLHTNGLALTQVSSPGADTGKVYATARTFDGSADYFTRNSEALLQTGDVDFTLAAWVYSTQNPGENVNQDICTKYFSSSIEYGLRKIKLSGITSFRFFVSATASASTNYDLVTTAEATTLNTWLFIAAWHDAANNLVGIQINSNTPTTASYSSGVYAGDSAFRMAYSAIGGSRYFPGRLGPVAMWKSAAGAGGVLSSAQRLALYNSGAGLAYSAFTT